MPGKAMVIVLRTGLIHSRQVDTGIAVASVFLETLTMMAVGACIAVPVLAVWFFHDWRFLAVAIVTAVAAGLPTLPPVFSRLAKLLGVGRSSPDVAEKLAGFKYPTLAAGWIIMVVGWIVIGASLWAMLRGLSYDADWPKLWYRYTAIVAMAVVGGFASMIPGGLGPRGRFYGPARPADRNQWGSDRRRRLAADVASGGNRDFGCPVFRGIGEAGERWRTAQCHRLARWISYVYRYKSQIQRGFFFDPRGGGGAAAAGTKREVCGRAGV